MSHWLSVQRGSLTSITPGRDGSRASTEATDLLPGLWLFRGGQLRVSAGWSSQRPTLSIIAEMPDRLGVEIEVAVSGFLGVKATRPVVSGSSQVITETASSCDAIIA